MSVSEADLSAARDAGILTDQTYSALRDFLAARRPAGLAEARFDLTHVLWYAGALVIMAAMGLFTTEAFNALGGWALTATGLAYGIGFAVLARVLVGRGLRTPAGLAAAVAVSMVPLAIYGVQEALDLWRFAQGRPGDYRAFFPYVHGSWLYMELGAIIAAAVAVRLLPFSFILMPGAVALWFMSMDAALWLLPAMGDADEFHVRRVVSIWFGLALIAGAWSLDLRGRKPDLGFWPHLAGAAAFWGGLSFAPESTEAQKALFCALNVVLILFGVFLRRRVYAVFGTIGVAGYLGHLASRVFDDAILFSFALSAIGLGVILLGISYRRRQAALEGWMSAALPPALRSLRPAE